MPRAPNPRPRTSSPSLWLTTAVVAFVGVVVVGVVSGWNASGERSNSEGESSGGGNATKGKGKKREGEDEHPTDQTTNTSPSVSLPNLKDYKGTLALLLPSAPTPSLLSLLSRPHSTSGVTTIYVLYPIPKPDRDQPTLPFSSASIKRSIPSCVHLLPYTEPNSPIHMCKALNPGYILLLPPLTVDQIVMTTPNKTSSSTTAPMLSLQDLQKGLQGFGGNGRQRSILNMDDGVEGLGKVLGFLSS
ncbi:BZ3500_MvSof-1268-A1-R1_Chr3-1g06144 [Microbotryum saponariae]|uniref:BZ3500_MvSof-1268-A1-R1_Chr3-1g06144 protein n=1 Tax=Microbotryum saponariae TaxID=289078 RepID=A0A2X0LTC9_9BASI|nr:BZ3500_MvSof-1268-A1-R1_Chr3-1g06144 [Microbotryum saponariae]SDA04007.1 BZ3501_MvSof-1269-A2-R1_Chr3-2g05829 [Microbotryum saponariae]